MSWLIIYVLCGLFMSILIYLLANNYMKMQESQVTTATLASFFLWPVFLVVIIYYGGRGIRKGWSDSRKKGSHE